jgi:glycosyltransferase involved in cell wall biosynthesis
MTRPLVSAIIPVFNGERHVADALRSVFAQDYRPIEVIVVDDGSTDDSAALLQTFPDIHYIHQPNAGVAAARNTALQRARGEFIAFLDQDDQWTPNKLTRQVSWLMDHPELGFVVAKEQILLDGVDARPPWLRDNALDEDLAVYLPGVLVARRSAFDAVGAFDPSFINGSDTDWIYRAKDKRIRYEVIPETLLIRRVHAKNASHALQVNRREIFRALHTSIRRQREERPS